MSKTEIAIIYNYFASNTRLFVPKLCTHNAPFNEYLVFLHVFTRYSHGILTRGFLHV